VHNPLQLEYLRWPSIGDTVAMLACAHSSFFNLDGASSRIGASCNSLFCYKQHLFVVLLFFIPVLSATKMALLQTIRVYIEIVLVFIAHIIF